MNAVLEQVVIEKEKSVAESPEVRAIVTILNRGVPIGMESDLAIWSTLDGFFIVNYQYNEETIGLLDLTDFERQTILDEEELEQHFETAEEAAAFYLRLTDGKMMTADMRSHSPKRTLQEKVKSYHKGKYF